MTHTFPRGRRAALLAALVLVPLAGTPREALAQAPATAAPASAQRPATPFRRGQWGMEFAVDQYATHVGFLKFRSPTKAWVLDVAVGGGLNEYDYVVAPDSVETAENRGVSTYVLLGLRSYRALTPRAVRTVQFGITGNHAYGQDELGGVERGNTTTLGGGLRLDIGGAYFFTPGFSVGGALGIGGRYTRSEDNRVGQPTRTSQNVSFSLDGSRAVASLYF